MTTQSKSAKVHSRLNHPVVDSDGHMVEFEPAFLDYLKEVAGPSMVDRYNSDVRLTGSWGNLFRWYRLSPEERHAQHATRSPWWALPTKNTLDRATRPCRSCSTNAWMRSAWILLFCIPLWG